MLQHPVDMFSPVCTAVQAVQWKMLVRERHTEAFEGLCHVQAWVARTVTVSQKAYQVQKKSVARLSQDATPSRGWQEGKVDKQHNATHE